eukprot:PhM_4_TR16841/c0_g1_i1/m.43269
MTSLDNTLPTDLEAARKEIARLRDDLRQSDLLKRTMTEELTQARLKVREASSNADHYKRRFDELQAEADVLRQNLKEARAKVEEQSRLRRSADVKCAPVSLCCAQFPTPPPRTTSEYRDFLASNSKPRTSSTSRQSGYVPPVSVLEAHNKELKARISSTRTSRPSSPVPSSRTNSPRRISPAPRIPSQQRAPTPPRVTRPASPTTQAARDTHRAELLQLASMVRTIRSPGRGLSPTPTVSAAARRFK